MGCGLGLPAPCAPRPSTLGGPAAPAAAENLRIGGGLSPHFGRGGSSSPSLLNKGVEEATVFELFSGCFGLCLFQANLLLNMLWTLTFS